MLQHLLSVAQQTCIGQEYQFSSIESYVQFRRTVPIHSYDDIAAQIDSLKNGAQDIFWPGCIRNFAVSAGTTGQGKHLPLSKARLQSDHIFMRQVALAYLKQHPNILSLWGDHLSMPGSVEIQGNLRLGEISGFTALNVPLWLHYFQIADPSFLTTLTFQQKFDWLLDKSIGADLRIITAVPSWILTLFQQVLAKTGRNTIAEIWPNLKLLVCGGVKLANYKSHLQKLAGNISLDFIETYGASEGYIGFSDDLNKPDLRMMTDNGIFFEAIPDPSPATAQTDIEPIPIWQVEPGIPYALLVTTNAGLWRYTLNDVVKFTSRHPLRFVVKGRLHDMLDDFGEAVQLYEAERALQEACASQQVIFDNFSITPVLGDTGLPFHRWFIQFETPLKEDARGRLALAIDQQLQQINRHYAIRRTSQALGAPVIECITQGDINRWMRARGKDKAQGKLPKILEKNTTSLS